jgi:hypothetical protein
LAERNRHYEVRVPPARGARARQTSQLFCWLRDLVSPISGRIAGRFFIVEKTVKHNIGSMLSK